MPADQVRPLDDWLTEAVAQPRLATGAAFNAIALLAGIGTYAVAAYGVGQGGEEIGLRIAGSATRAESSQCFCAVGPRLRSRHA